MFKRVVNNSIPSITLDFEGRSISAQPGESVAAALLAADISVFRQTPTKDRARGPFCMIGACFDCLVVVDGQPNQQACQTIVTGGMKVRRQNGAAEFENAVTKSEIESPNDL